MNTFDLNNSEFNHQSNVWSSLSVVAPRWLVNWFLQQTCQSLN